MPARVIATMVLHREMWNINAVTKEIAAPTTIFLLQKQILYLS
jgi:hypothetical protein